MTHGTLRRETATGWRSSGFSRRFAALLICLVMVAGPAPARTARAEVSSDVEKLPLRRAVLPGAGAGSGAGTETGGAEAETGAEAAADWIEIVEDSVLAGAAHREFKDVRFVNRAGEVIPCAALAPSLIDVVYHPWRTVTPQWRTTEGREEWVIDLGPDHPVLLSLDLGSGAGDHTLEITASADSSEWVYVGLHAKRVVYHGEPHPPATELNLSFPERFLKLSRAPRGPAGNAPVRILRYEERETPREAVSFTITRSAFRDRTWQADLELQGPERAVGELVLEVPRPTPASLPIRIESGQGERRTGVVIESAPDWSTSTTARLTFEPVRTGTLRIIVEGADPPNAPFTVREVRAVPFRWRLPVPEGWRVRVPEATLWVAFGDDFLEPRDWGMEGTARRVTAVDGTRLGPVESNPHHRPPGFGLEWLKRRPALLSAAMLALLALVALLTLRKKPPAGLALLLLLVSCGRSSEPAPLTVWAAASLTDVLPRVAERARRPGDPPVRFTFDATSKLARQLEAGAPADLFFSADQAWMDDLIRKGAVDPATRTDLFGNSLVLVVPAVSQATLDTPEALRSPDFRRLGLADEAVPAGRYARDALLELGLWPSLEARVVNGSNVRTVLAWVARGEVDAGIVYATDARTEPAVRALFTFPDSTHTPIVYAAAVTTRSTQREAARRFIEFCRADTARALFAAAGFRNL